MKRIAVLFIVLLILAGNPAVADTIVLPADTVTVGAEAFYGVNADTIILPEGVTAIGDDAFGGNDALKTVYVPDTLLDLERQSLENNYPGVSFVPLSSLADQFVCSAGTDTVTITEYTGELTEVVIPSRINGKPVTGLAGTFDGNEQIKRVVIPEGVTSIGADTFRNCFSLMDITFPQTLTDIDRNAFDGCGGNSVAPFFFRLPDYVDSVHSGDRITHGYQGCSAVLVVTPKSLTAYNLVGDSWFTFEGQYDFRYRYDENHNLQLVKYYGADPTVTIPGNVELRKIDRGVFMGHAEITDAIIPEGVSVIGDSAFEGCVYLADVTFPSSIETIGKRAFHSCGSACEDYSFYILLPGISDVAGYGDDCSESSDASFCSEKIILVTDDAVTGEALKKAHYDYYRTQEDAEFLRNPVRWNE